MHMYIINCEPSHDIFSSPNLYPSAHLVPTKGIIIMNIKINVYESFCQKYCYLPGVVREIPS